MRGRKSRVCLTTVLGAVIACAAGLLSAGAGMAGDRLLVVNKSDDSLSISDQSLIPGSHSDRSGQ